MGDELKTNEQVVEAVKKEIKTFGESTTKNYTELRKNYEDLKVQLEEKTKNSDVLIKETVIKLTDDITTRQEDLDTKIAVSVDQEKKVNDRIDAIEVAFKRIPKSTSEKENKEMEEAKDFMVNATVVQNKSGNGVKRDYINNIDINVDNFKAYKDAFVNGLLTKQKELLERDEVKALTLGSDPDGGYTVTPVMNNRIITRQYEADPMRQLAGVTSISTDAMEWMVDFDEAGWGWEGETETGDETGTPKMFKKRIPVHVMYAKPKISQTLIEDSGINIENYLADHVSKRFSRGEGASFVSGNGIGKPRGFLTYDDYATAGTDEWGKIERTNMGAAAALTADGFIDVKYSLTEYYLERCTWLMNRLTVADAMKLKNGDSDYIWKPGIAENRHGTILGLPLRMSTTMPVVAAGALSIALADWAEAYMVVDRLGITMQRDPYTVIPMVMFYTRKRVGGDVANYQAIKIGVVAA